MGRDGKERRGTERRAPWGRDYFTRTEELGILLPLSVEIAWLVGCEVLVGRKLFIHSRWSVPGDWMFGRLLLLWRSWSRCFKARSSSHYGVGRNGDVNG